MDRLGERPPWLFIVVAVIATASLAMIVSVMMRTTSDRTHHTLPNELELSRHTASIQHLDEVLTMSALMYAATGDTRWHDRYEANVEILDKAIKSVRQLSPKLFDLTLGADTDDANQALVAMERHSTSLVASGNRDEAMQILLGSEYAKQKNIYKLGNERVISALRNAIEAQGRDQDILMARLHYGTYALVLVVGIAWVFVIRVILHDGQRAKVLAKAAQAANSAKGEFLANMSHELRTPLSAIVGYADMLSEADAHSTPRQRQEYIETIKRNSTHLLALINEILDFTNIESQKLDRVNLPMNPWQVVEDVATLMCAKVQAKGIRLETTRDTQLPELITTDPARLKQILVHLVGNAVKFTEVGTISVRVSLDTTTSGGPYVRYVVSDTGIGMSNEQMAGLFEPFAQGDSSVRRRFGGAGLGLRISRNLAQLLGGQITASSQIGVGSVFTLLIPTGPIKDVRMLSASPTEVAQPWSAPETSSGDASKPLAGVHVYLAEDGPDNRRLVVYHLQKAGAEVTVFENGRRALEALTVDGTADGALKPDPPCDLLLTDMQMPEMDGYTLASILRSRGWPRRIVALTAHAMSGDAERCLAAGCDAYATKPINRSALIDVCLRNAQSPTPLTMNVAK